MKAWQIQSAGGIDGLALADMPLPSPGPDEVAIRMRANSINYRDLGNILNPEARGVVFPLIPNSDGAGEIIAVGNGVHRFSVGDRVATRFFQGWQSGPCTAEARASSLGAGNLNGVLAEQIVLNQAGIVHIPQHLDFDEAACLPCAAVTAWRTLVCEGSIKAGDIVLLLGTGGVSIFALQFAVMMGARVIITSSSDEKLARATAIGAWRTINYRSNPDWQNEVLALTDGKGVDIAVETGGPGTLEKTLQCTRVAGVVGLIGVLTGGKIDPTPIMRKSISLQGIYVGSGEMFDQMNRAIDAQTMRPVIDQRFRFSEAPQAYRAMQCAGHFGKIVISF